MRSHMGLSLTGGFYLGRNDFWPNLVKCSILALLAVPYFVALGVPFSQAVAVSMSCIVAGLILVIKFVVICINRRFDDAVAIPDSPVDRPDESEFELPSGVSIQLWSRRRILFRRDLTVDTAAMNLIEEGFDPDSVFTLANLIQTGAVTRDTVLADPSQHVHSNIITLGNRTFRFPIDRAFLSRICTRPSGPWEAIRSACLGFVMTYLVSCVHDFGKGLLYVYVVFLCALAAFSMLLPPPCDPYSTTLNDPTIGSTRAVCISLFSIGVLVCKALYEGNVLISNQRDFEVCAGALIIGIATLPLLILMGFIGHPVTSLHWLIEALNKYLFGMCGSPSLLVATVTFFTSAAYIGILFGIFAADDYQDSSLCVSVVFTSFFSQFSLADINVARLKSVFLKRLIAPILASLATLGLLLTGHGYTAVPIVIVVLHIFFDFLIPLFRTHQKYFFVHGKICNPPAWLIFVRHLSRRISVPFLLIFVIADDCFWVAPLMILISLRLSESEPHTYALALFLGFVTFPYELSLTRPPVSLFIALLLAPKIVRVLRVLRMAAKSHLFPEALFSSPFTNPIEFLRALTTSIALYGVFSIYACISLLTVIWSCITGAPPAIFLGLGSILQPGAPRPNVFYDAAPSAHTGFASVEKSHGMEAPVYASMADELSRRLHGLVHDGALGLVTNDSFFLFTDGDLIVIVHVVAIEPGCVHFQMRGLEYVQQTICHGGELSIVQQLALEQSDFGNATHAIAFTFTMWDIRAKDLPFEMITVGRYIYQDTVYAPLGRDVFDWFFRAVAFICVQDPPVFEPSPDAPPLTSEQTDFLEMLMRFENRHSNHGIEMAVKDVWAFLMGTLCVDGLLNNDALQGLFSGPIRAEGSEERAEFVCRCVRFGVLLTLSASVGLAPGIEEETEFVQFLKDQSETPVLPFEGDELYETVIKAEGSVISLNTFTTYPEIIRFSRSEIKWTVLEMESECVRGFWANEAKTILFDAATSNERLGIQFDSHLLRNITNQSCNPPIGYPVVVSNVNRSVAEW
jgi:hypothetical protein